MAENSADAILPSVHEICTTMGGRFLRRLDLLVLHDFTLIQGLRKVVGPIPDQPDHLLWPCKDEFHIQHVSYVAHRGILAVYERSSW